MNTLELTQKLIQIPSYFAKGNTEKAVGEFIYQFLSRNTCLKVVKQLVAPNRYNIFAYTPQCENAGKIKLDLLFIDHIDTVEPKAGWEFDQFKGKVSGGKLFGLGAYDTKGNVAALLEAATIVTNQKVGFLFYVDEEYDFLGMRQFVAENKAKLKIKRIISADGGGMAIRSACRGLVELDVIIRGQTGHAANPKGGISAITSFYMILDRLNYLLESLNDKVLGRPTLNVAYIRGGLFRGKEDDVVELGREGNNIADYVEAVIECRTNTQLDASLLVEWLDELANEFKVGLKVERIRHNLAAWQTDIAKAEFLTAALAEQNLPINFTDPSVSGYVDLAMAATAWSCPAFCIGVVGGNAHGVNEWVDIASLSQLAEIFRSVIKQLPSTS